MPDAAVIARVLGRLRSYNGTHVSAVRTSLRTSLTTATRRASAPIAEAASELIGDLPQRVGSLRSRRAPIVMQARALDRAAVGSDFRARLAHSFPIRLHRHLVGAGLATLLVAVGVVSALPGAETPTARAGAAEVPPRAVIAAMDQPDDPGFRDLPVASPGDPGFVDTNLVNVERGDQTNDGQALIKTYTVQSGDTVVDIAKRFGITGDTIYWANKARLKDPYAIMPGQVLDIPPCDGLVITVGDSDTLDSLATKYGVSVEAIVDANNLTDAILVAGEKLIIPGAREKNGIAAPTPEPTPAPRTGGGTTTRTYRPPSGGGPRYTGGRFAWPVLGGGNYISQRYWAYHRGVDIAARYGTPVRAAVSGTVIYAGWRNNGGGRVIWVQSGGVYTTYNHLSAIYVRAGQVIGTGQTIAGIGSSGWSTGPHLHFEVWTNYPWAYGTTYGAQNPCAYLGC